MLPLCQAHTSDIHGKHTPSLAASMHVYSQHMLAFRAPVVSVVVLGGQGTQAGAANVEFPPSEKLPAAQATQRGPP